MIEFHEFHVENITWNVRRRYVAPLILPNEDYSGLPKWLNMHYYIYILIYFTSFLIFNF